VMKNRTEQDTRQYSVECDVIHININAANHQ
jgi:hypothetical protein